MATFLDIGILSQAQLVFAFVLVWVMTYSILSYTKAFNLDNHLRALIAIFVALITLISPQVLQVITIIVPWFVLMFIFITFVLLAIMIFGVSNKDIADMMAKGAEGSGNTIRYWIIIIGSIILIAALGYVFFQDEGGVGQTQTTIDPATGVVAEGDVGTQGQGALFATLFHPRVLGLVFVMLLGLFAVLQLAR